MIIPVRCFSCGALIAHKWEEFQSKKAEGNDTMKALDEFENKIRICRLKLRTPFENPDEIFESFLKFI